ncbi:hypothetical protein AB0B40_29165 [Streptomyces sp. NPDC042638]|uniref:hypothetical protein n=1 Tax=Streptomyces sp. NPDC042638 TaxID=3154333 RepID=UPI0034071AA6
MLAACTGGGPGGYTAVGAGQDGPAAVAPTGPVTMVPLDGPRRDGTHRATPPGAGSPAGPAGPASPADTTSPAGPAGSAGSGGPTGSPAAGRSGTPEPSTRDTPGRRTGHPGTGAPGPGGGQDGRTTPPPASPGPAPGPTTPATPAALSWGDPATEDTGRRWCQQVTVGFRNSGGTAVRSGEVTFGTHVIGALGVDWGTVGSTVRLPVPLAPGARSSPTWTVCVDAWRVPLGMHIETRDVSVEWG